MRIPYTCEFVFSEITPKHHTKEYNEFPMFRKKDENNRYIKKIDNNRFYEYFSEPFKSDDFLYDLKIAGDNVMISDQGLIELKMPRPDENDDLDFSKYKYGKINVIYEGFNEQFYFWIVKTIINTTMNEYDITMIIDLIPSFYENIINYFVTTTISRRSFDFFSPVLGRSVEDEIAYRLERYNWKISCDYFCQASGKQSNLFNLETDRLIIKDDKKPNIKIWNNEIKKIFYNVLFDHDNLISSTKQSYNNFLPFGKNDIGYYFGSVSIGNITLSPIIRSNFSRIVLKTNIGISDQEVNINDFLFFYEYIYNEFINKNFFIKLIQSNFWDEYKPLKLLILEPYTKKDETITHVNPNIKNSNTDFKLQIERSTDLNEYRSFCKKLPYHFKEFHTEYSVIVNQDEIGNINKNYWYLNGYDPIDNLTTTKWQDNLFLLLNSRLDFESMVYDVYPLNWPLYFDNDIVSKLNHAFDDYLPILTFSSWFKIYLQESDIDRYLRSNSEQRSLQKQLERNRYYSKLTKYTVGGGIAGLSIFKPLLAKVGSTGPWGAAIAILGGTILGIATFFLNEEVENASYEKQENAKMKDLEKDFVPSTPNSLVNNYAPFNGLKRNYIRINIFSLKLLIMTSYKWEESLSFIDKPEYSETKHLYRNLRRFGELCNYTFDKINIFLFSINYKVDHFYFYLRCTSVKGILNTNITWSKIVPNINEVFNYLLTTGIRFVFVDEIEGGEL